MELELGGVEGGVHDCDVEGLGVFAVEQSVVMLHERVWIPLAEHALQLPHVHVSAVQDVGAGVVDGGVQDCEVAGLGVVTPAQSLVIMQL